MEMLEKRAKTRFKNCVNAEEINVKRGNGQIPAKDIGIQPTTLSSIEH
jgi:hypothetical protein